LAMQARYTASYTLRPVDGAFSSMVPHTVRVIRSFRVSPMSQNISLQPGGSG
jgi:hypothetical protein